MTDDPRLPVDVGGLPAGVRAVTATTQPDRRRNPKTDLVHLVAVLPHPTPPLPTDTVEARFVAGATRRSWTVIKDRYGTDRAATVALRYVTVGLVEVEATTRIDPRADGAALTVDQFVCWRPTCVARQLWADRHARTSQQVSAILDAAAAAASRIADLDAGLAATLTNPGRRSIQVVEALTYAADALAAGRRYDGPRAWSQAHYPDVTGDPSKHRDDIGGLLTDADASPDTIAALGVGRPADFGVGNVNVTDSAGRLLISGQLRGVVRFDPASATTVQPVGRIDTVAVVENLQAAQAAAVDWPVAVCYTAGPPSAAACTLIGQAARHAAQVLVVPDADLGGVRIAERVIHALPHHPQVTVIDVGTAPHTPGVPFGDDYQTLLERHVDGPAGALARAVLARRYRVEQEATIRAALNIAVRA